MVRDVATVRPGEPRGSSEGSAGGRSANTQNSALNVGDLADGGAPAPGLQTGSEGRASPSDPLLTHPVTTCRVCAGQRSPALVFSSPSQAGGLFTGRHRGRRPDNQLVFGNRLCPCPESQTERPRL